MYCGSRERVLPVFLWMGPEMPIVAEVRPTCSRVRVEIPEESGAVTKTRRSQKINLKRLRFLT